MGEIKEAVHKILDVVGNSTRYPIADIEDELTVLLDLAERHLNASKVLPAKKDVLGFSTEENAKKSNYAYDLNYMIGYNVAIDEMTSYIASQPAEVNKKLLEALKELALLMQDTMDGTYIPDSFTLQPAVKAISGAESFKPNAKVTKEEMEIVSDEDIDEVWDNSNFGPHLTKREVVRLGVLKCASGWAQGRTSQCIITELGLITEKYKITKKGQKYLWEAFSDKSNF